MIAMLATVGVMSFGAHADASTVTVKEGNTVSGLAEKYNVSVKQIKQWNHLNDENVIIVGDKLNIDGKDVKSNVDFKQKKQGQQNQQSQKPVQQPTAPVQQTQQAAHQPVQQNVQSQQTTQVQPQNNSAKEQIAYSESRGSYTAQNGRYYGKYQLDLSYLGGDLSPQHQEDVFQQYCNDRYGSVEGALSFRQQHGWY
jgi:FOG: LysM repeat